MRNKRILREYNELPTVELKNHPNLQAAFRFNCFKSTDTITDKDGEKAVYRKATKPENASNPNVFFYEDGRKEFRDNNDQVKRQTTWYCQETARKTDPSITGISNDVIDSLKSISGWKLWSEVSGADTPKYNMVNLKDVAANPGNFKIIRPEILRLFKEPAYKDQFQKDFLMWMPMGGSVQKDVNLESQFQKCLTLSTQLGFTDTQGGKPVTTNAQQLDINTVSPGCAGVTEGPYYVYKETPQGQVITSLLDAMKPVEGVKDVNQKEQKEKDRCKNIITLYYDAATSKEDIDQNRIDTELKPAFNACATKLERGDFKGIFYGKNELLKKVAALKSSGPVQTNTGMKVDYNPKNLNARPMQENFDRKLKNIIRENLSTISENKKKSLIQEQKIVNTRFKFLLENTNTKTKKGQKELAKQLFVETAYLHTQGFDKKIINEGFWDMLKGLFGDSVDGALEYFKEYAAKWLLDQFGVDSSGWIGNIVITAIGNLDLSDIPKLTDCNFVTKLLSKSLAEGAVRKLQGDKGATGPLAGILRNTIVEVLSETDLGQKIESALGSVLCPMISKIAGKMGMAGDTLKSNAMGTTEFGGGMMDSIGKLIPGLGGSAMTKMA
jgi:hypothetical protein